MPSAISQQIDDYQTLALAFQDVLGVIITEEQRKAIVAKLNRVMQAFELDSVLELAEKMRRASTSRLNADILQAITDYDPCWFKYPAISHLLQQYVLNNIPKDAKIWVVGCEDGSLAYTVAIELAEHSRQTQQPDSRTVIATDVSEETLQRAATGLYRVGQLQNVPQDMLSMYFSRREELNNEYGDPQGDMWEVKAKIREKLSFNHCDLLEGCQPTGTIDVIICPEILVYFSNSHRAGIIQQFASALKPGGILIIGEDQAVISTGFERVEHPDGTFYRQKGDQ